MAIEDHPSEWGNVLEMDAIVFGLGSVSRPMDDLEQPKLQDEGGESRNNDKDDDLQARAENLDGSLLKGGTSQKSLLFMLLPSHGGKITNSPPIFPRASSSTTQRKKK